MEAIKICTDQSFEETARAISRKASSRLRKLGIEQSYFSILFSPLKPHFRDFYWLVICFDIVPFFTELDLCFEEKEANSVWNAITVPWGLNKSRVRSEEDDSRPLSVSVVFNRSVLLRPSALSEWLELFSDEPRDLVGFPAGDDESAIQVASSVLSSGDDLFSATAVSASDYLLIRCKSPCWEVFAKSESLNSLRSHVASLKGVSMTRKIL